MKYFASRVASLVPTVLLASAGIFLLMRVLPGDVAKMMLIGPEGTGTPRPEDIAALRAQLGLDRPLAIQYLDWLLGIVRLDVGNSLVTRQPVFTELFRALPVTLELGLMATLTSLVISIPLGVVAAVKRGTWMDYAARIFSLAGLSVPTFWVGMLMILVLVQFFHWTAPLGYAELLDDPVKNMQQLIWPIMALGYAQAGLVSRLVRSSLLEVLREDYVRTARSKGLKESDVIVRHALRNSMLPVITVIGLGLANIVGGTVIVETVFSLPGVGRLMVDSINKRDYPVVQTATFIFALVFALANLSVDLLYAVLDPRLRLR